MKELSWHIYGQQHLTESLERDFTKDNLQHTTLVAGPSQIGKFTTLKRLAQFIHCPEQGCIQCNTCRQIEEEAHIDTFIFKIDGNDLGIKDFRNLKNYLNLSPQNKYKVVIIQNIERLSIPLQNSMLKILEEPPEYVYFLISTSNIEGLLETITSRARVYKTGLATDKEVEEYLSKEFLDLPDEMKMQIKFLASGKIGKANLLATDGTKYNNLNLWLTEIDNLMNNSSVFDALKFAETLNEYEKHDLQEFLELLINYLRKRLLESDDKAEKMDLTEKIMKCFESIDLISKNVNVKICLEVLFLHCFTKLSSMTNH